MAIHITLQEVDQNFNIINKKYTADDPFIFPDYQGAVTELELMYDMENMVCELYLNSDRENGLEYHKSILIDDMVYPKADVDRQLLKNMTNRIYAVTKEVEDKIPNNSEFLEYEY